MGNGRFGTRPHKFIFHRTTGKLLLHCFSVAVTETTEAVKKKDAADGGTHEQIGKSLTADGGTHE